MRQNLSKNCYNKVFSCFSYLLNVMKQYGTRNCLARSFPKEFFRNRCTLTIYSNMRSDQHHTQKGRSLTTRRNLIRNLGGKKKFRPPEEHLLFNLPINQSLMQEILLFSCTVFSFDHNHMNQHIFKY